MPAIANTPSEFGREYGLLIHQRNAEDSVPRIKMLSILLRAFPKASDDIDLSSDVSICTLEFLNRSKYFYRYRNASQRDLLIWSYQLDRLNSGKKISTKDSEALYKDIWLEARSNNWLKSIEITHYVFQNFLYKYLTSKKFLDYPFYEGLVLEADDINVKNYNDINDLPIYQSNLFEHLLTLKSKRLRSKTEDNALKLLTSYYQSFKNLESEIYELNHPLNKLPNMPDDIRQAVIYNNLNEVLSSVSYDYSKDISNRRYNVIHGASKLSGDIVQPGAIIDFMYELGDKNWWDYKWGWVIINGEGKWLLGGGLCGSATMIFNPSWKAGLQIIKRYPHSLYYNSLYPAGEIGLDATIYRNSHKNLKIRNNTNSPIIYYVEDNKDAQVVTVHLIGNSPYKSIEIEGPIEINRTTYKWIRRMENFDGTVNIEELVSKYGGVYN